MIKIFNSDDRDLSTAGNIIINPTKCIETRKKSLNGWYIDVEIPIKYKDYIEQDMLCVVKTKSKLNPQAFRIKNIEKKQRKIIFEARHVMFDAEDYFLLDVRPTNQNGQNALSYVNQRTDKKSPFTVFSNVTVQDTAYFVRKSLLEAWVTIEERWGGVFDADNWDIRFLTKVGNDNGETVMYGKNLQNIEVYEDWSSVVTRLYPVGYNGLMLPEVYLESDVEYGESYTRTIDFMTDLEGEEQTSENLIVELRSKARAYLEENKVPKISYTIGVNVNESLEMGDTVHIKHPLCSVLAEVLEYVYNVVLEKTKQITVGNYSRDVKTKFNTIKENINKVAERVTTQERVIEAQTNLINSMNKNGLVYIDDNEILILDKLPREEAKNVWRFGLGGLGFSSNGYEGPFETAITMDGQINANFITVGQMNVARIEGLTDSLNEIDTAIEFNRSNVQIVVNKQNEQEEKLAKMVVDINEIIQKVENIADLTKTVDGVKMITFDDAIPGSPIEIRILGNNLVFKGLYFDGSWCFDKEHYFTKGNSALFMNDKVYDLGIDEVLRQYNGVCDEYVYDYMENTAKVIRRIGVNGVGGLYVLPKELIEELPVPAFELKEGSNVIMLPNYSANMCIRYVVKNDYTNLLATRVEMKSNILQTREEIKHEVDKKVTDAKNELTEDISTITQKADRIDLEVKRKVGNDEIISSINQSAESVKIRANKIELTGVVTVSDLQEEGSTTINGANIKTGTISSDRLDTENLRLGGSNATTEISAKSIDWLSGSVTSPSGRSSNPIAYFGAFNKSSMNVPRDSVGMEIWDNGEIYIRHMFTESGTDTSGYMGFIKTFLASVDSLRAINFIGGVTSAGSRGLNVSTYAETFDIYAATSDERLKKNIVDAKTKGLDVINKIRLISFNWRDSGKYQDMGFSAQQLKEVCEDFVSSVKQPKRCRVGEYFTGDRF